MVNAPNARLDLSRIFPTLPDPDLGCHVEIWKIGKRHAPILIS